MANNNYKVSIITVVLNDVCQIEKTIQSVQNQKYNNIEYIVIDGKSTDGTQNIIKKNLEYIDYYISESDSGIYDAMNKGIRIATGEIIAFLNSGDWYEEDAIKKIVGYFSKSAVEIIMADANIIEGNSIMAIRRSDIDMINLGIPCCHQAVFARKSVFGKIGGFNLRYQICADYEWLLRAYTNKVHMICVHEILVNYLYGGVSEKQSLLLIDERMQISLNNAIAHNDKKLIDQIKKIGCIQKKEIEKDKLCIELLETNKDSVLAVLDQDDLYYIWGTGYYGSKCFQLFQLAGIQVKGFIDNCIQEHTLYGYPVINPSDIQEGIIICIATPKYEAEIIRQIEAKKIKNEYMCFSEFREQIISYGTK